VVMVTDELVKHVTKAWGQGGADWLDRLPAVLAEIEERWSLQVSGPFDSSYHYVAPAVREDGIEVVLKLGVPGDDFRREVEALRIFSGRGAVRLLKSDPLVGVMMLERLKPGAYLGDVSDEQRATSIAAGVMRRLWRPAPSGHQFPEVSEYEGGLRWLQGQLDGTGPLPRPMVVRAEAMLRELLEEGNEPVVLHGDLHPWNILSAEREPWLAIDPKGVVGDPAYELGPFIYSLPFPQERPARVLARRLDQFAQELGFKRERIVNAVLPRAVLAAWPEGPAEVAWPVSGADVWDVPLAYAQLLIGLDHSSA
jgi:streptomycin 6-kinase